jgi:hypothetical protein
MTRRSKAALPARYTQEPPRLMAYCQEDSSDTLRVEASLGTREACVFVCGNVQLTPNQARIVARRLVQFADAFIPPPAAGTEDADTTEVVYR